MISSTPPILQPPSPHYALILYCTDEIIRRAAPPVLFATRGKNLRNVGGTSGAEQLDP